MDGIVATIVIQTIDALFRIFFWLLLIRAVMSWFRPAGYNRLYADVMQVLVTLTDPLLAPIRRVMPPVGPGLDFSPLIALILLNILRGLVRTLLVRLLIG
ncbi:MAG TPA: YggT family protein [Bacillota bacterium]